MTRLKTKILAQIFCVFLLFTGPAFGAGFQFGGLKLDVLKITSGGTTTTFTKADKQNVVLTGSSAATWKLPDATGLSTGYFYWFSNESTGLLTVQNGASENLTYLSKGSSALFMVTSTATTGGNWNVRYGAGVTNTVNSQSGTSYTLAISDQSVAPYFSRLEFTSGSAVTATVPPNSSVAFPIETRVDACQYGAGKVTFAQGSGVTIRSKSSNKAIGGQYVCVSLYKRATDEWWLIGDLIAWVLELLGLKLHA